MAKKNNEPEYPKVIETFMPVNDWYLSRMTQDKPSSFNGTIRVERYRISVEKIEDPVEVIHERLENLWLECDNHHHRHPLQMEAAQFGYTFKGERGSKKLK